MASRREVEELSDQTTLANARRARDQRQARAVCIHRLVEEAGERLDLLVAADHGDLHPFAAVERVGQRAQHPPHGHGHRLSTNLARLWLAEDEGVPGGGIGSLAGKDGSRLGHLLQSSGDIDGVAGHHVLVRCGHHLAGVDPHANGEANAVLRLELGVQLRQSLEHLASGPQRPLGVVLPHDRDAKGRHDRVAHELLHRPAPGLDRRGHDREESLQEDAPALRVEAFAERGRPGDVGEEDGHELALLETRHGRSLHRKAGLCARPSP